MAQWQWFPDTWAAVALGGMQKETKTPEPREPSICEPWKEVCSLFWRRGAVLWRSCGEGSCGSEGWTSNPTPSQRSDFNYFIISFTKTGTRENENKPQKLTLGSSQAVEPQTTTLKSVCYWTGDSRPKSTGTSNGLIQLPSWRPGDICQQPAPEHSVPAQINCSN